MELFRELLCQEKNFVNKTSEAKVNVVCKHRESFLNVESHCTRKSSNRHYLNTDLSIAKMYTMYKKK